MSWDKVLKSSQGCFHTKVELSPSYLMTSASFMEACGCRLREVGTTNKTHLDDYARAVTTETRALLKVHTSNYRIVGFTEKPALAELVTLGHEKGLPVVEDLGSGSLCDLNQFGIRDEPTVQESVRAGVDVVSFSGDKLLGGPQAGIVLGRSDVVARMIGHHEANGAQAQAIATQLTAMEASAFLR